ncbi:hypothetical protein NIES4072_52010 [Nostoc commune NIES-4072]|uniref:Uncharacterized protein n=1 Tax=Nostoc commune NIES-4072 TaxID=2005467 RepID=A0A2R5FT79_NOSCO|nr:hypothetical protein [Nostoc commune]BBD67503.1 hypothetical protein NIES4070_38940 [Nostoc commune HK-02]GBG21515.1 hypothetical protein NIES4072_52010 [Nostoc commune NIES-4072]
MLSNLDLIREFVQNSIHKKEVLLSNPALTAQTVYNTNQLIAKAEGVIATVQLSKTLSEFSISPKSSQWELINQALAESSYLLKGEVDSRGFYKYQYCEVPKGYKMHCTKCVLLWRAWWKYRKYTSRVGIPLELLIRKRDSWYPIRDLIISDGLLYIKTLGSEIALDSDDLVTWLSKVDAINIIKEIPTTET